MPEVPRWKDLKDLGFVSAGKQNITTKCFNQMGMFVTNVRSLALSVLQGKAILHLSIYVQWSLELGHGFISYNPL